MNVDAPAVDLSPLGEIVCHEWEQIPGHQLARGNQVRVLQKQVMPDHFHGVLYVEETIPEGLGSIIGAFKARCTQAYKDYLASLADAAYGAQPADAPHGSHQTVGSQEVLKASPFMAKENPAPIDPHTLSAKKREAYYARLREQGEQGCAPLFESNFDDSILAAAGQLDRMINYVHDNPRRAILRRLHPDLFRLRRELSLPTADGNALTFSALGNLFLADFPCKQVIACSRSLKTDQLDALRQEALFRAEEGAVTLTAAISEGERLIARTIREAGWPLIVLLADGFPPEGSEMARYFKPGGVYFDACVEGRLLLLEPTAATLEDPHVVALTDEALRQKAAARGLSDQPLPHTTRRWHYMALNTLASLLGE